MGTQTDSEMGRERRGRGEGEREGDYSFTHARSSFLGFR